MNAKWVKLHLIEPLWQFTMSHFRQCKLQIHWRLCRIGTNTFKVPQTRKTLRKTPRNKHQTLSQVCSRVLRVCLFYFKQKCFERFYQKASEMWSALRRLEKEGLGGPILPCSEPNPAGVGDSYRSTSREVLWRFGTCGSALRCAGAILWMQWWGRRSCTLKANSTSCRSPYYWAPVSHVRTFKGTLQKCCRHACSSTKWNFAWIRGSCSKKYK